MIKISTKSSLLFALCVFPLLAQADCPEPGELYPPDYQAKDFIWKARGGWKSEVSFVKEVTAFLGAQWTGTNVGTISCIYRAKESSTFPLVLQNGKVVYYPKEGAWKKPIKQGGSKTGAITYKINCVANRVKDCPFSNKDLQSELEDEKSRSNALKDMPSQLLDPMADHNLQQSKDAELDAALDSIDEEVKRREAKAREFRIRQLKIRGYTDEQIQQMEELQ